jgi:hypothetical protein
MCDLHIATVHMSHTHLSHYPTVVTFICLSSLLIQNGSPFGLVVRDD